MLAFKRLTIGHLLALVFGIASAVLPTQAAENPKRGGELYGVCSACHSLQPGIHLTGPTLADMWGKKAASAEGFIRYSKGLKSQDFAWDENTLNAWLADPKAMVPGNYMTFRGIRNDRDRGDLIAFLKLAMAPGGAKAVIDKGLITADGAEGQTPENLRSVGPKALVLAAASLGALNSLRVAPGEAKASAQLYKNPNCNCCESYAAYLRSHGYAVTTTPTHKLSLIRREHGVPRKLAGCHTTIVAGYVVEGHVPVAALDKLLAERPKIKGISLLGMPDGSPGMTGVKREPFAIYEISDGPEDGPAKVYVIE